MLQITSKMTKLLVNFISILLSVGLTLCTKCSKEYDSSTPKEYITVTCLRITSTSSLDYPGERQSLPVYVDIVNSKIPILPQHFFSGVSNIAKLNLVSLEIEELSPGVFDGLNNLKSLNLTWNELRTIPTRIFEHLNQLHVLDLSENSINILEEDSFLGLVNLKELLLAHNEISILNEGSLKGLSSLTLLDISNNPLEHFSANLSQTKVNIFNLSNGRLREINFALFPKKFITLDLSRNRITSAESWDKLDGEYVTLKWNNLTEVDCYPQDVLRLCLTYNKIKRLRNSCSNTKKKLETLDLGFNELTQLEADDFLGLDNLKSLNLQNNHLKDLGEGTFVYCPKLKVLDLALNRFRRVDPNVLSCLHELKNLYITRDHFGFLNTSSIANATVLYFDHNDDNVINVKHGARGSLLEYCRKYPSHRICHRRPSVQSGNLSY